MCPAREVVIEPVELKAPVRGSYSSAEPVGNPSDPPLGSGASTPPVIRTRPSRRTVAVWNARAVVIAPAGMTLGDATGVGLDEGPADGAPDGGAEDA